MEKPVLSLPISKGALEHGQRLGWEICPKKRPGILARYNSQRRMLRPEPRAVVSGQGVAEEEGDGLGEPAHVDKNATQFSAHMPGGLVRRAEVGRPLHHFDLALVQSSQPPPRSFRAQRGSWP